MTNHWRDIKNADVIFIAGANPAEAHPVGFQWFVKAKLDPARGIGPGGGATIIHVDPRFTRTSALADIYARIRVGTDVAFFGGLIRHVIENDLIHRDYVRDYTNASFLIGESYAFHDGLFSGYDPKKREYDTKAWGYDVDQEKSAEFVRGQETETRTDSKPAPIQSVAFSRRDPEMKNPRCVFQLLRQHYARYTPEMVETITGIPKEQFLEIAKIVGECG